jgi:hypothetical protein
MDSPPKIAVIYSSATGNVAHLVHHIASGACEVGAETRVLRVAETATEAAIASNLQWQEFLNSVGDPSPSCRTWNGLMESPLVHRPDSVDRPVSPRRLLTPPVAYGWAVPQPIGWGPPLPALQVSTVGLNPQFFLSTMSSTIGEY